MAVLRAAIVQMRSGISLERNVDALEASVAEAAATGAQYVQTPEMTGLVQRERSAFFATVREERDDPIVAAASELAARHEIILHIGSTPIRLSDRKAANRAFLFGPDGALIARYDKIHMFDVDLDQGESWRESAVYSPGREAVLAELPDVDGRIGMGICYDCRFPELTTSYARVGAEILSAPACFTRQTGEAHWHVLMRSRAIENGAFMIAAAQGGRMEDGRECYGHSLIVDPWGRIVAEVEGDEPGIAFADLDLEQVSAARAKIPNLINHRSFTLRHAGGCAEDVLPA